MLAILGIYYQEKTFLAKQYKKNLNLRDVVIDETIFFWIKQKL